jgi:hypothetical protein
MAMSFDPSISRAYRISESWRILEASLTNDHKDRIGILYLKLFLGADQGDIENFANGDPDAYEKIGLMQSSLQLQSDVSKFWNAVKAEFPKAVEDGDLEFLCTEGGVGGVLEFLFRIGPVARTSSPVLSLIFANMHAYK